jgi:hypothetical protein
MYTIKNVFKKGELNMNFGKNKRVLRLLKDLDAVWTSRLNKLREERDCFFLTTDEIFAYKDMVYNGYIADLVVEFDAVRGEEYTRDMMMSVAYGGEDPGLRMIYKMMRDRMLAGDTILGEKLGTYAKREGFSISDEWANMTVAQFADEDREYTKCRIIDSLKNRGLWFDKRCRPDESYRNGLQQAGIVIENMRGEYEFLTRYADAFALPVDDMRELGKFDIKNPTLLMMSTSSDVLRCVTDINFRGKILGHTPLILDGNLAEKLKEEKLHSMPVWEGRNPEGDALEMLEVIRAGEIARKGGAVVGNAERAVQNLACAENGSESGSDD